MNHTRDEKWLKAFGEHFRMIRLRLKLTQKNLAFESEVEVSQISRLENGKINPTVTSLLTYAKAMNISASELFEFDPEKEIVKLKKKK